MYNDRTDSLQPWLVGTLGAHLGLVDELYARYRERPEALPAGWRELFEGRPISWRAAEREPGPDPMLLARVHALVHAYRVRGHLEANLDPLGTLIREKHPDLAPATYGLGEEHMDEVVPGGGLFGVPPEGIRLRDLLGRLRRIYCDTIGVEYMYISDPVRRTWLAERLETMDNRFRRDEAAQRRILERLVAAETFERFVHLKYVGTKRFSLEGGETLIALLDVALEQAGLHGIQEVVLGMAHRGRLNVLANIVGKSPSLIFAEFEDIAPESVMGGGDVKYHMGYSSDYETAAGHRIHLSLAFNPSHLEAVDPVVLGRVRAKQRRRQDTRHERVLGVLIHGDAAFAGQGLVAETLNLSNLHGYRTGGTLHIIVNNQIGFTTSPHASRSTPYCTDVARMIQVPIFHVNGDDPEAVAHVVELAMEYRRQFRCDVVIDMFCFRRYGHNESDEPSFTQPLLYQRIARHPPVAQTYARSLIERRRITQAEVDALVARYTQYLERELAEARVQNERPAIPSGCGYWRGYRGGPDRATPEVDTAVPRDILQDIADKITTLPPDFSPHPKIARLLQQRRAMGHGELPLDWGMAEALAFGTLLREGRLVRFSGQDTRRGTFSHRHAVLIDIRTGAEYVPLAHVAEPGQQGEFRIYDSMLSEAAVLGFEYGYSLDYPDGLVMWEAQFGDFANGAQVILDQFVSSAEDKWARLSGLVLLLPHGYEGQGPEHSSARFERFLQLCAEDNMQVVFPTTPAQYFHLLRRQVLRPWRKPLIVLSPKSLLRHPEATSSLEELSAGRFHSVLPDPLVQREAVQRIFLCTGKVYYDLLEERVRRGDVHTALVRLEQLYPLRTEELQAALRLYPAAIELCWVQEEPANMGAREFILPRLLPLLGRLKLRVVSRPESASPATGSTRAHLLEQRALLEEAFSGGAARSAEREAPLASVH
ncbi:MAG: 2-oxoglutarate dehydrogenase E1 component [Myxococcales bacterium]|nr:2-oxoglutarate dehydrogenase E1 component [Myxococcota bacterium]MDW8283460.1 2-oxoglutarate dehydrogenase E1 component [Myxococcales bacterium]